MYANWVKFAGWSVSRRGGGGGVRWPPGYETDDTLDPARDHLSSSRVKPKKLRIESGQQLFDFRNLVERGLFTDRGQFLRTHEF